MSFIPSIPCFINTSTHSQKTCKNGSFEPFLHAILGQSVKSDSECGQGESKPRLVLGKDAFYH